jgi:hypothetical protein
VGPATPPQAINQALGWVLAGLMIKAVFDLTMNKHFAFD